MAKHRAATADSGVSTFLRSTWGSPHFYGEIKLFRLKDGGGLNGQDGMAEIAILCTTTCLQLFKI